MFSFSDFCLNPHGLLTQLVEYSAHNGLVTGPIPVGPTKFQTQDINICRHTTGENNVN